MRKPNQEARIRGEKSLFRLSDHWGPPLSSCPLPPTPASSAPFALPTPAWHQALPGSRCVRRAFPAEPSPGSCTQPPLPQTQVGSWQRLLSVWSVALLSAWLRQVSKDLSEASLMKVQYITQREVARREQGESSERWEQSRVSAMPRATGPQAEHLVSTGQVRPEVPPRCCSRRDSCQGPMMLLAVPSHRLPTHLSSNPTGSREKDMVVEAGA